MSEARLFPEVRATAFPIRRLLAVAAIWHITFVLAVFLIGRAQLLPKTIDRDGIGLSFAIDSRSYRIEAENMAKLIHRGELRQWTKYKSGFHVKLYSLWFAVLGPLVGFNILAAEPLNLAYFLSIIALAYGIARQVFDSQVARLASSVVSLWPSLLLHSTQLLRDALFIPSMLLLAMALVLVVNRTLSLRQGIMVAIPGVIATLLLWLCRGDTWEVVLMILLFGAALVVLVQLKTRHFSAGNLLAIAAMLVITFCLPKLVSTHRQSNIEFAPAPAVTAGESTGGVPARTENAVTKSDEPPAPLLSLGRRVARLRHKFIVRYPAAGSNIDTDVELESVTDIVRYLPRAALIGFCAPFPNMWITKGAQVGLSGRLIAGAEMLLIYLILGLAGLTILSERHLPTIWLLLGICSIGCVALGFVVVNISTLYRMRYAYFILIIILGMKGLALLRKRMAVMSSSSSSR